MNTDKSKEFGFYPVHQFLSVSIRVSSSVFIRVLAQIGMPLFQKNSTQLNQPKKYREGIHMVKHLTSIAPILLLMGFLFACHEGPAVTDEVSSVLRFDVPIPLASLDPTEAEGRKSGSNFVFPLLYSHLAIPDEDGTLKPELATSWSYDPTRFSWTIQLREDARFHNGESVTARDVVYSLSRMLKRVRPHLYQMVEMMHNPTNSSVNIVLKSDAPSFLSAIWAVEMVPESLDTVLDYGDHPIGSGPFRYAYRNGEKDVVLVANKDYYGGRPSIDNIVFHYEPNKEKSWARLISGRTDIACGIHPADYEMIKRYENLFYLRTRALSYYTILLYNTQGAVTGLGDPNIRMALSLGIDKMTILNEVFKGYGKVATGPIAVDHPYHSPEVKPVSFDPEEGVRLLLEAGWSYGEDGYFKRMGRGRSFEFTVLYPENEGLMRQVAENLQINLNDMGIRACLTPIPADELARRYVHSTDFEAVLTEIEGGPFVQGLIAQWCPADDGKPTAAGGFKDSQLTKTLTEAACESDPERAIKLYQEAEARIALLQPGTFLFHRVSLDIMSKRIELPYPFSMDYPGVYRLRFASIRPQ